MGGDILILIIFLLISTIWFSTAFQSWRLFERFCSKYPDDAAKYLYQGIRHPENALFFLRPSRAHLLRRDPELCRMRKRYIRLLILSVVAPPILFILLLLTILVARMLYL